MSELISGKEAKLAWVNGQEIQVKDVDCDLWDSDIEDYSLGVFDKKNYIFRLKPQTITINGVEVPAPFKPKRGELYYHPCEYKECGYWYNTNDGFQYLGAWRTEGEIKQVVSALRSIFSAP